LFHTGWFIESALTQFAAMMTLRTIRSAWASRPAAVFALAGAGVAVITVILAYSPIAAALGFSAPPAALLGTLIATVVVYALGNEVLKRVFGFGDRHAERAVAL
jgi:Mg2+-importing ATPase